jgi:hypothetical protein
MSIYIPKSQMTTGLYTPGGEYEVKNTGEEYIGFFWAYSNGKLYTGTSPVIGSNLEIIPLKSDSNPNANFSNATSFELSEYSILNYFENDSEHGIPDPEAIQQPYTITTSSYTDVPTYNKLINSGRVVYKNEKIPDQAIIFPTDTDYDVTEYVRYYTLKRNEPIFYEINKKDYNGLSSQSKFYLYGLYQPIKLYWKISGAKTDVETINRNVVELYEKKYGLVGLTQFFKNYLEYYQYPLANNLYTVGGEFADIQGNDYIGFYNYNPKLGATIGKVFNDSPTQLVPINQTIEDNIIRNLYQTNQVIKRSLAS